MSRRMALILVATSLALTLLVLVASSNRGFDFTDEAYYAAWISDPGAFNLNIHPFGIYYNAFFVLSGRSIVAMRLVGMGLLLVAGGVLGFFSARYCRNRLGAGSGDTTIVLLGALLSLDYYMAWVLTPNYNLLANVSAALIFAGCLGWATPERFPSGRDRILDVIASVLIGMGGCQAFFGKPTFGLLAALGVLALLVAGWRRHGLGLTVQRAGLVTVSCGGLLAFHVSRVMPISSFVQSLLDGMRVLNFGNSLSSLPKKSISEIYHNAPLLFVTATAVLYTFVAARRGQRTERELRDARRMALGVLILNSLFLLGVVAATVRARQPTWQALGVPFSSLAVALINYGLSRGEVDGARLFALKPVFLLVMLPFAIAFGTVSDITGHTGASAFAFLLSVALTGRILFEPPIERLIQVLLSGASFCLVAYASLVPYGLAGSMFRQRESVAVPFSPDHLMVDGFTKQYIDGLAAVAAREGVTSQTKIMDLSGRGPGTALFLGGRAVGYPWLIPSYLNSPTVVDAVRAEMSDSDWQKTWIVGPIDPSFLSSRVVGELERRSTQYRCVANLSMVARRKEGRVTLWKPTSESTGASQCPTEDRLVPPICHTAPPPALRELPP